MKTSTGLVVAIVVCILAGIGALGYNTVKSGKSLQKTAENTQKGNEDSGPYTITASAKPGGSISPSGRTSVLRGSSQTFIATAHTGYRVADVTVDGWSVGAVPDLYHDDSSSYTFDSVTANHTISASFDEDKKH